MNSTTTCLLQPVYSKELEIFSLGQIIFISTLNFFAFCLWVKFDTPDYPSLFQRSSFQVGFACIAWECYLVISPAYRLDPSSSEYLSCFVFGILFFIAIPLTLVGQIFRLYRFFLQLKYNTMSLLTFEKSSLRYYAKLNNKGKSQGNLVLSNNVGPEIAVNLSSEAEDRVSFERLRRRLTHKYSNIELVVWVLVAMIIFSLHTYLLCLYNEECGVHSKAIELSNKIVILVVTTSAVLIGIYVHYKTKLLPDPYYFLYETKLTLIFPFISAFFYVILDYFYPRQDENKIYDLDPFLLIDIGYGLSFFIAIIYPLKVLLPCTKQKEVDDITLREVLDSPAGLILFKSYMVYELSVENLNFYLAATKWKQNFHTFGSGPSCRMASNIMNRWIEDPGRSSTLDAHCVNLSYDMATGIRNRIAEKNVSDDLFDDAMQEVYNLIWYNSFSRFKKTSFYRRFLGIDKGLDSSNFSI